MDMKPLYFTPEELAKDKGTSAHNMGTCSLARLLVDVNALS